MSVRYRPFPFGIQRVKLREGAAGVQYFEADHPLEDYAVRITDRLVHWAREAPQRTFVAQRVRQPDGSLGDWRHLSYGAALTGARCIAQSLIDRRLSPERPVAILSGNDIDHALMALGCLIAGVPYCPVSPAYSTLGDFGKLRHVLETLTPGLVFASHAGLHGEGIEEAVPLNVEVVLSQGLLKRRAATPFGTLLQTPAADAVDTAMAATGPDTITKFLFTSGSTKLPKAVINTHGMWCSNLQQMLQSLPALKETPPVLVDWLPWNHTFGGNHNFGLVLYNGGTMFIDEGKPTPGGIAETLRNLREISPTAYFNVPTGFEAIANAMKTDERLRRTLLARVRFFYYAGAGLAQPVWDALHATQEAEIGERIVMGTGLGMTESSPCALFFTDEHVRSGDVGVPVAGFTAKLVPVDGKVEVRYKGPNITPGYWRNPEATAEAFDEEGFFRTGDAVLWIDPANISKGLKFDGRIAEDFKLATGTFVSVGPLRAKITAAGAPYIQDVVLTGINLKEVGALVLPTGAVRTLAGLPADASMQAVLESAPVQAHFQKVLDGLAASATGSANRVARMHLMHEPPSLDKGEVTDKGSINQRAVLKHRDAMVQALHDGTLPFTLVPGP